MSNLPLVTICVPTFKRPQFLADLLESMRGIEIDDFRARLIVVDNDEAESARVVVERIMNEFPVPLIYVVEPKRGIASARNRLVREAEAHGATYVAFVDDDQFVEPSWLRELVKVTRIMDVQAVVGRWVPWFDTDVPPWVRRSGFWERPRHETGTPTRHFGTGNVLIELGPMLQVPGPFDERQNLTGGEDTLFFDHFHRQGFLSVWCDESLVHERIPASRATSSWMIKRGYRAGVGHGTVALQTGHSAQTITLRAAKSLALIATNLVLLVPGALRGRAGIVPRTSDIARGLGGLAGLIGQSKQYQEYREIHGR